MVNRGLDDGLEHGLNRAWIREYEQYLATYTTRHPHTNMMGAIAHLFLIQPKRTLLQFALFDTARSPLASLFQQAFITKQSPALTLKQLEIFLSQKSLDPESQHILIAGFNFFSDDTQWPETMQTFPHIHRKILRYVLSLRQKALHECYTQLKSTMSTITFENQWHYLQLGLLNGLSPAQCISLAKSVLARIQSQPLLYWKNQHDLLIGLINALPADAQWDLLRAMLPPLWPEWRSTQTNIFFPISNLTLTFTSHQSTPQPRTTLILHDSLLPKCVEKFKAALRREDVQRIPALFAWLCHQLSKLAAFIPSDYSHLVDDLWAIYISPTHGSSTFEADTITQLIIAVKATLPVFINTLTEYDQAKKIKVLLNYGLNNPTKAEDVYTILEQLTPSMKGLTDKLLPDIQADLNASSKIINVSKLMVTYVNQLPFEERKQCLSRGYFDKLFNLVSRQHYCRISPNRMSTLKSMYDEVLWAANQISQLKLTANDILERNLIHNIFSFRKLSLVGKDFVVTTTGELKTLLDNFINIVCDRQPDILFDILLKQLRENHQEIIFYICDTIVKLSKKFEISLANKIKLTEALQPLLSNTSPHNVAAIKAILALCHADNDLNEGFAIILAQLRQEQSIEMETVIFSRLLNEFPLTEIRKTQLIATLFYKRFYLPTLFMPPRTMQLLIKITETRPEQALVIALLVAQTESKRAFHSIEACDLLKEITVTSPKPLLSQLPILLINPDQMVQAAAIRLVIHIAPMVSEPENKNLVSLMLAALHQQKNPLYQENNLYQIVCLLQNAPVDYQQYVLTAISEQFGLNKVALIALQENNLDVFQMLISHEQLDTLVDDLIFESKRDRIETTNICIALSHFTSLTAVVKVLNTIMPLLQPPWRLTKPLRGGVCTILSHIPIPAEFCESVIVWLLDNIQPSVDDDAFKALVKINVPSGLLLNYAIKKSASESVEYCQAICLLLRYRHFPQNCYSTIEAFLFTQLSHESEKLHQAAFETLIDINTATNRLSHLRVKVEQWAHITPLTIQTHRLVAIMVQRIYQYNAESMKGIALYQQLPAVITDEIDKQLTALQKQALKLKISA